VIGAQKGHRIRAVIDLEQSYRL